MYSGLRLTSLYRSKFSIKDKNGELVLYYYGCLPKDGIEMAGRRVGLHLGSSWPSVDSTAVNCPHGVTIHNEWYFRNREGVSL